MKSIAELTALAKEKIDFEQVEANLTSLSLEELIDVVFTSNDFRDCIRKSCNTFQVLSEEDLEDAFSKAKENLKVAIKTPLPCYEPILMSSQVEDCTQVDLSATRVIPLYDFYNMTKLRQSAVKLFDALSVDSGVKLSGFSFASYKFKHRNVNETLKFVLDAVRENTDNFEEYCKFFADGAGATDRTKKYIQSKFWVLPSDTSAQRVTELSVISKEKSLYTVNEYTLGGYATISSLVFAMVDASRDFTRERGILCKDFRMHIQGRGSK